jgi:2,4-dienoyl-CoA reductase-like NADH-dependent reductase (Old Yellow Enzyme family)
VTTVGAREHTPSRFPHLFSPLRVGPVVLKNRIVNSAHQTGFADRGRYTSQLVAYHRERARGGAALIVSQATAVTPEYLDLWNVDDSIIQTYREVAAAVAEHGAHYFAELFHPGRQSSYTGSGTAVHVAPSAVPLRSYGVEWRVPHAVEADALPAIVAAFGEAARRCREGGLSGVTLHFAHGNLVEQFISPLTNRRSDGWGGPLANRLRLAREITGAVREAVGPDLAVGARVTGAGLDPGEPDHLEMLEVIGTMGAWGLLDFFDVTMGHYADALNTARNIPNMGFPPGVWAEYGRGVKHVVDVPVFLVGRINHPQVAEDLIAGGACDAVVMARALIADPYFPAKAAAGDVAAIRPCVGSMNCFDHLHRGGSIRCIHNPVVSREREWGGEMEPAAGERRVVVVGGGPAGLECARVAAGRGHDVVLLEQERHLGGQVRLAARGPGRAELGQLVDWLARQCQGAAVDVRVGVTASPAEIDDLEPEVVVLATGSVSSPPPFPCDLPILTPEAVLAHGAGAGGHVVVYDETADWAGMSVALALAATKATVEVVTPATYPSSGLELTNWRTTYPTLVGLGVRFHPVSTVTAVRGTDVELSHAFGASEGTLTNVDHVVAITAPVARDDLHEKLRAAGYDVRLAGDALAPRGVEEAVYDGYRLGRTM